MGEKAYLTPGLSNISTPSLAQFSPPSIKVQIQLQGAEQITSAKIATLHHQLVYRLQNHALDLPTPQIANSEAFMILA